MMVSDLAKINTQYAVLHGIGQRAVEASPRMRTSEHVVRLATDLCGSNGSDPIPNFTFYPAAFRTTARPADVYKVNCLHGIGHGIASRALADSLNEFLSVGVGRRRFSVAFPLRSLLAAESLAATVNDTLQQDSFLQGVYHMYFKYADIAFHGKFETNWSFPCNSVIASSYCFSRHSFWKVAMYRWKMMHPSSEFPRGLSCLDDHIPQDGRVACVTYASMVSFRSFEVVYLHGRHTANVSSCDSVEFVPPDVPFARNPSASRYGPLAEWCSVFLLEAIRHYELAAACRDGSITAYPRTKQKTRYLAGYAQMLRLFE